MRIALTGANGFLGCSLARRVIAEGQNPILLARRPPTDPVFRRCTYMKYGLEDGIEGELPGDCGAVVHCAYKMGNIGRKDCELNIRAALALREAVRKSAPARQFVFVSSMSAHEEAQSYYGTSKLWIEKELNGANDCIVRPGLIAGNGGLFARIRSVIDRYGVVPIFDGGAQLVQPIWIEDVAEGIARICQRSLAGSYNLGSENALTFREMCTAIGNASGRPVRFIGLNGNASIGLLSIAERIGLRLPLGSENLKGLLASRRFETHADMKKLGLTILSLDDVLRHPDSRRECPAW